MARTAAEWFEAAGVATRAFDFPACVDAADHGASAAEAARDDAAWLSAVLLAAKCAEAGGDRARARVRLDAAARRQPAAVEPWRARALLEERAGAWGEAGRAWVQVIVLDPAAPAVRLALARTLAEQGRAAEAAACALGYLATDLRTAQAVAAAERVTDALSAWPGAQRADFAASLGSFLATYPGQGKPALPPACTGPWQALVAGGHGAAFAQAVARLAGSGVAQAWWEAHAAEVAALEQAIAAASGAPPRR